jgi:hypothetical protein
MITIYQLKCSIYDSFFVFMEWKCGREDGFLQPLTQLHQYCIPLWISASVTNYMQLTIDLVWMMLHRNWYIIVMVNVCFISFTQSSFSVSRWMFIGRKDYWCIEKYNIWRVTQRKVMKRGRGGEGEGWCMDRTCFIHYHGLQNYRNCLHSVTLVTWWQFPNLRAARCIHMQYCVS